MRCANSQKLISLALDEELTEYDRHQLALHLEACPDCARHQEVLEQGRILVRDSLVTPPENFEWKVQLGIQRALREGAVHRELPRSPRSFWLPATISTALVAATVVVAGGLWFGEDGPTVGDPAAVVVQHPVKPNLDDGQRVDFERPVAAGQITPVGFGGTSPSASLRFPAFGQPARNTASDPFQLVRGRMLEVENRRLQAEVMILRNEIMRLRPAAQSQTLPENGSTRDTLRASQPD